LIPSKGTGGNSRGGDEENLADNQSGCPENEMPLHGESGRRNGEMKFYIENFGCQMNDHDLEKMTSLLLEEGFEQVPGVHDADVVIVNTCCVREKAEQKFFSLMGRLEVMKRRKGMLLGVTGCISQMERDGLSERLPYIDFSLGPSNIHKVVEAVEQASGKGRFFEFSDNGDNKSLFVRPGNRERKIKANVTIMKGCNNFCTYCIVPYVRGREASRESPDILAEIAELAGTGVKEVTLLGQNVNSYNKGKGDISFPELLERINEIHGIERIRFVTSHPRDLSESLIGCFGRLEKLCESIHLPFQSGSDRILKLMNRGYTSAGYVEKIRLLRHRCPGIAITADCIVGFPGEEEADFGETMGLLEDLRFDGVFSFAYSSRKFTAGATLPGPVVRETAMERLRQLQTVQKGITLEKNQELVGAILEVMVEGTSRNSKEELTGRTRTNKIVNFKGANVLIGHTVALRIVKGYANSLRGEIP
jgi:tRNA-2-methylthio-N6-dimethylallyladenosine synthase